jgi:hypothetical protein
MSEGSICCSEREGNHQAAQRSSGLGAEGNQQTAAEGGAAAAKGCKLSLLAKKAGASMASGLWIASKSGLSPSSVDAR